MPMDQPPPALARCNTHSSWVLWHLTLHTTHPSPHCTAPALPSPPPASPPTHTQVCAQVLLTLDNLANRDQYINARNTFTELLAYGAIPVVNENVRAGGGECGCGWVDLGVWVGGVGVWVWGVEGGMCHAPAGLLAGGVPGGEQGREEADTCVWCWVEPQKAARGAGHPWLPIPGHRSCCSCS